MSDAPRPVDLEKDVFTVAFSAAFIGLHSNGPYGFNCKNESSCTLRGGSRGESFHLVPSMLIGTVDQMTEKFRELALATLANQFPDPEKLDPGERELLKCRQLVNAKKQIWIGGIDKAVIIGGHITYTKPETPANLPDLTLKATFTPGKP